MLWFKTLTGLSIDDIAVTPEEFPNIMEHLPAIKEAVNNAVATPYAVTESTHKEFVNELLVMTDADKAHLTSLGLDPAKYEVLDLGLTFNRLETSVTTSGIHGIRSKIKTDVASHILYFSVNIQRLGKGNTIKFIFDCEWVIKGNLFLLSCHYIGYINFHFKTSSYITNCHKIYYIHRSAFCQEVFQLFL
jgi:hypothetical protein